MKPQAQHMNKPTLAIDLTISTPGLALRSACAWEVLPNTHVSDHYPILTSINANWEQFHNVCLERITEDILEEAEEAGGRLNKKDGLTRYGDSHVKDKTS